MALARFLSACGAQNDECVELVRTGSSDRGPDCIDDQGVSLVNHCGRDVAFDSLTPTVGESAQSVVGPFSINRDGAHGLALKVPPTAGTTVSAVLRGSLERRPFERSWEITRSPRVKSSYRFTTQPIVDIPIAFNSRLSTSLVLQRLEMLILNTDQAPSYRIVVASETATGLSQGPSGRTFALSTDRNYRAEVLALVAASTGVSNPFDALARDGVTTSLRLGSVVEPVVFLDGTETVPDRGWLRAIAGDRSLFTLWPFLSSPACPSPPSTELLALARAAGSSDIFNLCDREYLTVLGLIARNDFTPRLARDLTDGGLPPKRQRSARRCGLRGVGGPEPAWRTSTRNQQGCLAWRTRGGGGGCRGVEYLRRIGALGRSSLTSRGVETPYSVHQKPARRSFV